MMWILSLIISIVYMLAQYLALVVGLTACWTYYKYNWALRSKRPVEGRDAVLITGATSGIGLAVAEHLYRIGYSVFAGYYTDQEPGYQTLQSLAKDETKRVNREQRLLFVKLDVSDKDSVRRAHEEIGKELIGKNLRLYGLVNNAGLGSLQPFAWLPMDRIEAIVTTNLLGTMFMCRQFIPMLAKSKGRILNVSSGLGFVPGPSYATYGITKCALIYLTKCLNMELSRYGIKSATVIPHNLIKTTNICANNVEANEKSWEQLRPEEKQLYSEEYRQHHDRILQLQAATEQLSKRKDTSNAGFLTSLKGESAVLSLEQSGVLQAFEAGLRLNDPPENLFAGDNMFNLVVGSLLVTLPSCCVTLLGTSIAPNLYK